MRLRPGGVVVVNWKLALRMWNGDATITAIGRAIGRTPNAVLMHSRTHGWPKKVRRSGAPCLASRDEYAAAEAAWDAGRPAREVATIVQMRSLGNLYRYAKLHWKPRSPPAQAAPRLAPTPREAPAPLPSEIVSQALPRAQPAPSMRVAAPIVRARQGPAMATRSGRRPRPTPYRCTVCYCATPTNPCNGCGAPVRLAMQA
jgi:hypothetical protein